MLVICLEGCHGSGKSELLAEFSRRGYHVLDEGFLDMPEYSIHPQSLLMETTWTCSWFERLLRLKKSGDNAPVAFADRSPFSAVYYGAHGHLLEPVIREHINEVLEQADIRIVTVHVSVEEGLLWERIQDRLLREPSRARLQEGKKKWMQTTLEWYNTFQWDLSVSNGRQAISRTADIVVQSVQTAHDLTDEIFEAAASHFSPPSSPNNTCAAAAAAEASSACSAGDSRMRAQTGHEPELASLSDLAAHLSSPSDLRRAASACDMHAPVSGASSSLPCTSSPPSEAGSSCGTPTLRHQRMAPSPQSRDSPLTNPESPLDGHGTSPKKMSSGTVRPTALSHVSATARLRCGSAPGEDAVWDHVAVGNTAQALRFD